MLLVFGFVVALAAIALAARELRSYRTRDDGGDLFIYSRKRLVRRLIGLGVLAATGATLSIWEIAPPGDPGAASLFLGLLLLEIVSLVVIAVLDLRETSSTARIGR